jgi:glycosyltransferase involved in cell wall biosynthesis
MLYNVLSDLCDQKLDKKYYEIIVVDNNSKDNTRTIVEEYCRMYPNICYKLEKRQGLSNARNRGWKEASGQYVGYIDDDCRIPETWLSVANNIIGRLSPGVFGGPFYAFYDSVKPIWYKDSYGSHVPFKEPQLLDEKNFLNIFGGNMFFRRELLIKSGGFDPSFGMCGKKIAYSEETSLLKVIFFSMPNQLFYFDPRLYVYHLVRKNKMTIKWIVKQRFAQGKSVFIALNDDKMSTGSNTLLLKETIFTAYNLIKDLIFGIFVRDRNKYRYIKNYLYEHTTENFAKFGRIWARYCLRRKNYPV